MATSSGFNALYLSLAAIVLLARAAFAVEFAGGTGKPNDPYQIATAEQLISIGSDPNLLDKHFVLLSDIDFGSDPLTQYRFVQAVIAPEVMYEDENEIWFETWEFNGSFDGTGHTVRNLVIEPDVSYAVGLFGTVGVRGRVENLSVENAFIRGWDASGGLVARNYGTILRCYASGEVSDGMFVGGLVGRNHGTIALSHASGTVSGENQCYYVGGLAGQNFDGIIINCYSDAGVQGGYDSEYLGALAGANTGSIANCYATGSVTAGDDSLFVGGLVGDNMGSIANCYATGSVLSGAKSTSVGGLVGNNPFGSIANCYAIGRVSAGPNSENVGGLLGHAIEVGDVSHCFWDVETSGLTQSGGGVGLTTIAMQDANRYLLEGWDWVGERANGTADLWVIPAAGGYPKLAVFCDSCEVHILEGVGTQDNPYKLASAEDVGAVSRYDPSACYRLDADVSMSGIVWTSAPIAALDGGFEGAGHTVSGLIIRDGGYLGLFAVLASRAQVTDIMVEDANVRGAGYATSFGALAGENLGSIARCRATGVVSGFHTVGGLVGSNHWAQMVNCGAAVNVLGVRYGCGGLAGSNSGSITGCFATGCVSGLEGVEEVGGLVGYNNHLGHITDCYARGNVSAGEHSSHIGGLLGHNIYLGLLINCYATGGVAAGAGSIGLGGLVGKDEGGTIQNCYFLRPPNGTGPTSGVGQPRTADQMMRRNNFVGWDFANTWMICEGSDYPRLRWEGVTCE